MPFEDAAQDLWLVGFLTGSRAFRSALSTCDILVKISFIQFQSGWHSIKHDTDSLTMRLSKNRNPEFSSECIHIAYFTTS